MTNEVSRFGFRTRLYTLKNRVPVACKDAFEWAVERAKGLDPDFGEPWRVAMDVVGEYEISTVFLGMDMRSGVYHDEDEPPLVFETMMFGPKGDVVGMGRTSTFDVAAIRHKEVVERVVIIIQSRTGKIEL